ncbi:MAG: SoxR reducing system RseC family protein [Calditrichaceae bacterium]
MTLSCVYGRVAEINDTTYTIELEENSACGSCGMQGMCSKESIHIEKKQVAFPLKQSQRVRLEFDRVIQTSVILYLIPVFLFFAGIALARILFDSANEPVQLGFGIAGLVISLFLIRFIDHRYSDKNDTIQIKLIEKYQED